MTSNGSRLSGYFLIIGAATLWGLAGTGAKFLLNNQLDVFVIVQTRSTLSCIVLWMILLTTRKVSFDVTRRDLLNFALLGAIGIAGSNWTYYRAIQLTNVATAIILQYTSPILVMLYEVFRKRDRFTTYNVSALSLSIVGCYLAVGGWQALAGELNLEGLFWANLSSVVFAYFNIHSKRALAGFDAWTGLVYSLTFTMLLWFFIRPPWQFIALPISSHDWSVLFLFAMVSILIPFALYFLGLKRIPPAHAIIIATLEPIVAIFSAAFVVNELLGAWQYVGAMCVITAIIILSRHRERTVLPAD